METISIKYTLVWRFKDYQYLKITRCRKVFNTKTNKQLKQVLNGGSIGYWVSAEKFIPTSKVNANIELIPKEFIYPF